MTPALDQLLIEASGRCRTGKLSEKGQGFSGRTPSGVEIKTSEGIFQQFGSTNPQAVKKSDCISVLYFTEVCRKDWQPMGSKSAFERTR